MSSLQYMILFYVYVCYNTYFNFVILIIIFRKLVVTLVILFTIGHFSKI